jgi:hypothetical protein
MEIRVVVSDIKSEPIAPHLVQSFSGDAVVNTSAPDILSIMNNSLKG